MRLGKKFGAPIHVAILMGEEDIIMQLLEEQDADVKCKANCGNGRRMEALTL
jgi:hypothetical protein